MKQGSRSTSLSKKTGWRHIVARLTPSERRALLLVLGLFALGCLVRLYRNAHGATP